MAKTKTINPKHAWTAQANTERAFRDAQAAEMVASGVPVPVVADKLGVAQSTVYRMLRRTLLDLDAFRSAEIDDWRRALLEDLFMQLDAAREDSLVQPDEENGLSYGQAAKIRNMARVTMIKLHNQIGRYLPGLYQGTGPEEDHKMPSIVIVGMNVTELIPQNVASPVQILEGETIDAY